MGGGKGGASISSAAAPAQEAPQPYQKEQAAEDASIAAREAQLKKAQAALGQEGSINTSPFGTQEEQSKNKGKTLLG